MDGSQKLPQRILGTIADNMAVGRDCGGLCLAVAAWMRYVGGTDETGQSVDVRDPLAERLHDLSNRAADPEDKARALLGVSEVFGKSVELQMRQAIIDAYVDLVRYGAAGCIERFCVTN